MSWGLWARGVRVLDLGVLYVYWQPRSIVTGREKASKRTADFTLSWFAYSRTVEV